MLTRKVQTYHTTNLYITYSPVNPINFGNYNFFTMKVVDGLTFCLLTQLSDTHMISPTPGR
jgi:hypothetical protein